MSLFKKGGKHSSRSKELSHIREERSCILSAKSDFFIREAYKTLRTNVNFALGGEEGCKVIVVTSSLQSEGKSLTAMNLAISFAETDKKVLLIDCDLRRPKVSRLLNTGAPAGLSNVLVKPQLLESAILRNINSVDYILAGDIPPNPSELLGSDRMHQLLDDLKNIYDYIILDSPPINMVTDAVVLAPWSDGVLFVVRPNQSERGAVLHAVEQLEYTRNKILGFVLNAVDLEKTNYGYGHRYKRYQRYRRYGGYGYGYSRGYGYGYGYGYQPTAPHDGSAEQEPQ